MLTAQLNTIPFRLDDILPSQDGGQNYAVLPNEDGDWAVGYARDTFWNEAEYEELEGMATEGDGQEWDKALTPIRPRSRNTTTTNELEKHSSARGG